MPKLMNLFLALSLVCGLGGCSWFAEKPELQFRLAETDQGPSLVPFEIEGRTIYLHPEPVFDSRDIALATAGKDAEGRPAIHLELTGTGARKFQQATERNIGKRMAVVLEGRLVSAPIIRAGIPGGKAVINGNFTWDEAEELAAALTGEI